LPRSEKSPGERALSGVILRISGSISSEGEVQKRTKKAKEKTLENQGFLVWVRGFEPPAS
jgi:hypothetical protein